LIELIAILTFTNWNNQGRLFLISSTIFGCNIILTKTLTKYYFKFTDYPDYSQHDYSQYADHVKYESGDEEKYRPEHGNGSYDYR
jgi:hypothetical protein